MAHTRRLKRERGGGAYHDFVPLNDDFSVVYAREGKLQRIGKLRQTLTDQPERLAQQNDLRWDTVTSWVVQDDPEYALDADGTWYDKIVDGEVMQDSAPLDASKAKKPRSRVSVCQYLIYLSHSLILCRNVRMLFGRSYIVKII